jgi:hypothetical protein
MITRLKQELKRIFAPDPCSDTGSNSQSTLQQPKTPQPKGKQGRVDWTQGTITYRDNKILQEVVSAISRHLDQKPLVTPEKGIAFHEHTASWECGAIIGWNEPKKTEKDGLIVESGRIYIAMGANALNRLYEKEGHWGWWLLFQLLDSVYGFKPTRVDLACDDFDRKLDLWDVESALRIGGKDENGEWNLGNFTSFKSWKVIENSKGGHSIYLGSTDSDEYVRLYDKEKESKGKIKSIRLERVLKDERAQQAFNDLLSISPDEMETVGSAYCISGAIGKTKFVNRLNNPREKNINRMEVLPFWSEWVGDIVPTGYSKQPVIRTMAKAIEWVDRQVIRTIAMFEGVIGSDEFENFFRGRLNGAKKRLTKAQEHLMAQWKADYELDCA